MTQKDLITAYAASTNQTQVASKEQITKLLEVITTGLINTGSVELSGFGKFKTQLQKGKSGTSPSGTKYTTQDKIVPKFSAAKAFKDTVAAGK